MLPFAFTIFAGAFLLFAVQPLIGKYILPWFGGGPGVWTTCLLFFQAMLLGGYVYAHLSATKLTPRRQVILHFTLLALALATLPIIPGAQWKPHGGEDPISRILLLLTASIGAPFFVLSATGPLMQQWFSLTHPGRSPYRLYALSNAGSLLALLAYPFFFERVLSRNAQAGFWSAGLAAFAIGCGWCAWRVWKNSAPVATDLTKPPETPPPAVPPLDRLLWFSLAAIASVLLIATTNKLCQDIAVIPFLWVLPLTLYLLTFILCFDHPRWYSRGLFTGLFVLGALTDIYLLYAEHDAKLSHQIVGYSVALFAACMVCHGELFRLRPAPARLTSFYLHIAAGGATGAFFVAVVAPLVFDRYLELQIGLWLLSYFIGVLSFRHHSRSLAFGTAAGALAAGLLVPALKAMAKSGGGKLSGYTGQFAEFYDKHWPFVAFLLAAFLIGVAGRRGWVREWRMRVGNFLMLFSVGLGAMLIVQIREDTKTAALTSRDFYGVLKVVEHNVDEPTIRYHTLIHGATSHGLQFTDFPQSTWPTSYYGATSGLGLAINHLPPGRGRRLGLVGLGAGTTAIYGKMRGHVRIYEIDPQVARLARTRFTYLERSAAQVDLVMGDARLSMERELAQGQRQNFDVLALDAFSSDAIPVHLLTKEAFATYIAHLAPDGVIAVHTSNRYLNLRPVVENLARYYGMDAVTIADDPPSKSWWLFRTTWILVTRNKALLASDDIRAAADEPETPKRPVSLWTDDHASVYEILK